MRRTDPPAPVVDLPTLARACGAVVDWYDALRLGEEPGVDSLDDALGQLAALPPVGGRLGRAIDVVVAGGAADPDDTIVALEQLRHASVAAPPLPIHAARPAASRRHRSYDVSLPGLSATTDPPVDRPQSAPPTGTAR
jgi:hypothetical protein